MTSTPTTIPTEPPEPTPTVEAVLLPTEIPPYLRALANDDERMFVSNIVEQFDIGADALSVAYFAPVETDDLICETLDLDDPDAAYYRTVLVVDENVYDYVGTLDDAATLCHEAPVTDLRGELLTLIDSVAADSVATARRQIATSMDLPARRVRLVDVVPVAWPDTSLGCPVDGQSYTEMVIEGYRLEFVVGEEHHIFHADFQTMVSCDAEDEVLPAEFIPLETATEEPEVTPESTSEVTVEATPENTPEVTAEATEEPED